MEKRFKNIFILGTGRNGSMSFAKACQKIENYSSGHETRLAMRAQDKLNYPLYHIESDNRLSWMLGLLGERFSENTFFVHLRRSNEKVAMSYNRRWHIGNGIMPAYAQGILNLPLSKNDLSVCEDYTRVLNANIDEFLRHRPSIVIETETFEQDFRSFWEAIEAHGSFDLAIESFHDKFNSGQSTSRMRKFIYATRQALHSVSQALRSASSR